MENRRRDFLKLAGAFSILPVINSAQAKQPERNLNRARKISAPFAPLPYTDADELSLAGGFSWKAIAAFGDVINAQGDRFGDCCDFTAFFPGESANQGFLWVNHEYFVPWVHAGKAPQKLERSRAAIDAEMKMVGGSFIELERSGSSGKFGDWKLVSNSKRAFRIDATTEIPLVGPAGGRTVRGTMGNCGGGTTPWGTILSGEENVHIYYGKEFTEDTFGWGVHYDGPEADYGWVVEIDPRTSKARKLTALGRFAHEGATFAKARDGRAVVYMGDDAAGQCLYKFISKRSLTGKVESDSDLLLDGSLYCADLRTGKWQLIAPDNPKLVSATKAGDARFKNLETVLINTRAAAVLVGGTPLNRPEDVKIHPELGTVYFTLTNNSSAGDFHGQVMMLVEDEADHGSLNFSYDSYLVGGPGRGFSCPDNLCFGPGNSLWVCTDISGKSMGRGAHTSFARNSMFRVEPGSGDQQTKLRHFLQAPVDAEVTGPCFSADNTTFFVSIQHPGEMSFLQKDGYTSNWPRGGISAPLSTVIAIRENGSRFHSS